MHCRRMIYRRFQNPATAADAEDILQPASLNVKYLKVSSRGVNKETRTLVTIIGVFAIIIIGGYGALVVYTGFSLPFSSVVSESMQHDNEHSEIGVIDTGDIVIVADPSKQDIVSYVKGTITGKKTFGDYGSVIIYNRDSSQNPVIHRAIVWLDYNESTGKWSSSELGGYSGEWYCITNGTDKYRDCTDLKGMLFIQVGGKLATINMDGLEKNSGFLTMGDNPVTNITFDQSTGIINHPIAMDDIRSVPILEIPWMGIIKLIMNGNTHVSHVPNSLPSLIMEIVLVFSFLILIDAFAVYRFVSNTERNVSKCRKWKKE